MNLTHLDHKARYHMLQTLYRLDLSEEDSLQEEKMYWAALMNASMKQALAQQGQANQIFVNQSVYKQLQQSYLQTDQQRHYNNLVAAQKAGFKI